jgi:hypothetical protein
LKIPEKRGMGFWKYNGAGPALVISPGRVYTGDKKPQGLNYAAIMAMINENPNEAYYATKLKRRQTLAESVEMGDLKGIGQMREFSTAMDLNLPRSGQDREYFEGYPRTGRELLDKKWHSRPMAVNNVKVTSLA